MARRRLEGLERVLGVNALFATAYGNVGSSIYYALGLVASFALGLTPVVFVITGVIFYLTAATYSEATSMYPEAGGSSSFARHAFNEAWSFFAAWAQMLNYVITIAISAFFVPHYLGGLFLEALRHSPGDVFFGIGVIAVLCVINVVGVKEAAGVNILLAVTDFATQLLLVLVGGDPRVLARDAGEQRAPRRGADLEGLPGRDPGGDDRLHGDRDDLQHGRGGQGPGKHDPARHQPRGDRGVRDLRRAAGRRALALPVTRQANGDYVTSSACPRTRAASPGDPVLGIVKHLNLGPLQHAGEIYVGLLAATILFIATNAGIIGVSRLVYSMGLHRQLPDRLRRLHPHFRTPWIGIILFGAIACVTLSPERPTSWGTCTRSARCCRSPSRTWRSSACA